MKKILLLMIMAFALINANAQTPYSGIISHTSSYFTMFPYSSSYDDGSHAKIFYDGNNKIIKFWNSASATNFTSIHVGSGFFDGLLSVKGKINARYSIDLDPSGNAPGDKMGFKVTESGNNTTKLHIFRRFTGETNDVDRLVIDHDGNIGIGTTTPTAKLDIVASGDGAELLKFSTERAWLFKQVGTGIGAHLALQGNKKFIIQNTVGEQMFWWSGYNGYSYFRGSMGIGTEETFGYKLAVAGKMITEEVVVKLQPWPDYVFESDYPLMPLPELEVYLTENKHLPGIPTAAEVVEEGVKLGEMNAKLLEKVEELTLYMIELNKQMEKLNRSNDLLKSENIKLKERIKNLEE